MLSVTFTLNFTYSKLAVYLQFCAFSFFGKHTDCNHCCSLKMLIMGAKPHTMLERQPDTGPELITICYMCSFNTIKNMFISILCQP